MPTWWSTAKGRKKWLAARWSAKHRRKQAIKIRRLQREGKLKNCGRPPRHGESHPKSPEWASWEAMHNRCRKGEYAKRGIKICKRWAIYENFLADMGRKPTKRHSIERINNDGDYKPSNCRWATAKEQANNRRPQSPWDRSHLRGVKRGPYKSWSKETRRRFNFRMDELAKQGKGPRSKKTIAKVRKTVIERHAKMSAKEKAELAAKISVAQKDRPLAPDHVAALKAAYKGERGKRRRARISRLMRNRVFSKKTKAKMSEAAKNRGSRK